MYWSGAVDCGAVDSGAVHSDFIPIRVKLLFTASLLDAQHQKDSVENKPASLLVVMLRKTINGIPRLQVVDRQQATPKRASYSEVYKKKLELIIFKPYRIFLTNW